VDTSEFVIAVCASVGFLFGLSFAEVPWTIVGALLLGGLIAAPIAAYIVRILPTRIMGTAVGGFILLVNANTFFDAVGISGGLAIAAYVVIIAVWVAALIVAIGARRQEQDEGVEGQAV
jgi:mannitol-specific phosphotransferase system IIBC component